MEILFYLSLVVGAGIAIVAIMSSYKARRDKDPSPARPGIKFGLGDSPWKLSPFVFLPVLVHFIFYPLLFPRDAIVLFLYYWIVCLVGLWLISRKTKRIGESISPATALAGVTFAIFLFLNGRMASGGRDVRGEDVQFLPEPTKSGHFQIESTIPLKPIFPWPGPIRTKGRMTAQDWQIAKAKNEPPLMYVYDGKFGLKWFKH